MTKLRYYLLRGMIFLMPLGLLACNAAPSPAPIPAPPADPIVVKEVLPVPCEIAQVPPTEDPVVRARKGDNVFDLAKIALASRQSLLGEIEELRAANQTPCPGVE